MVEHLAVDRTSSSFSVPSRLRMALPYHTPNKCERERERHRLQAFRGACSQRSARDFSRFSGILLDDNKTSTGPKTQQNKILHLIEFFECQV